MKITYGRNAEDPEPNMLYIIRTLKLITDSSMETTDYDIALMALELLWKIEAGK